MTNFWATGRYDLVADLIADLGRDLVAAAGVGPGMRVLDVGAGTGNATLPAAEAGADVVATDVTPELLDIGERVSRERGLAVRWLPADAQDLPLPDAEFDVVLSCIGAMFAPDHAAAAAELLRVCRPGGVVAMANWTPDGAVGRFFGVLGRYGPPPGEGPTPTAWGDPAHVTALLGAEGLDTRQRTVRLGFTGSPEELCAHYRAHFPPVIATYAGLDAQGSAALDRELTELLASTDTAPPGGPPCYELEYLQVRRRPGGRAAAS